MKIIVTDEVAPEGLKLLQQDPRIELDVRPDLRKSELKEIIGEYDGIVTRSGTTVDRDLLDAGERLKIVARAGVGIDNIDVEYASSRGVIVVNAPLGNTNSAAEHTMSLLLALCRNITRANESLKNGEWKRAPFTGIELKGKVAGVIGLGKVGGRVATRLKAFECEVLGCDPYIPAKRALELGVRLVSHGEIYSQCDIITIHTPLNDETRGMIGGKEFVIMKYGVVIINAARGGIIDEWALLANLNSGKVAGAAVDVWSEEPPRSDWMREFIGHEKMIVTPHLGANTHEAQVNVAVDVAREILNYLDEMPMENAVNIPRFDLALMDRMLPFMNLMRVLSEFVIQLMDTFPDKVTFTFAGSIAHYDCTPLTICGLAALLNRIAGQDVNMVNAAMVAKRMGVNTEELKSTQAGSFSNMITMTISGEREKRTIAGALFDGAPRIVRLRDYQVDFAPSEDMLLMAYEDRPGMIGKIGTILGMHDLNIAAMNLGRREKRGEAMVVLSLDSEVSADVIEEVRLATAATFIRPLRLTIRVDSPQGI